MSLFICKFCFSEKPSNRSVSKHQQLCKSNPDRKTTPFQSKDFQSTIVRTNQYTKAKTLGLPKPIVSEESRLRRKKSSTGKKHTQETKDNLSIIRTKFLQDNPDKHPWKKSTKFISGPCERLKNYLTLNNKQFVAEWTPLEGRMYSIDIAFPDIKFGIEVNGNQHYNKDGSLKPYYQERHDLITQSGWTLIQLHYTQCYNDLLIDSILIDYKQPDYTEYFIVNEQRKQKKQTLPRGHAALIRADAKWEPYKERVVRSGIVFSKFGWVKDVALLLGIYPQKVNGWMKRYLPEFYETQCFQRK